MGLGLRLGARCWARVLPLLGPRPGARCSSGRSWPLQAPSRLVRGPALAWAAGARGLRSGVQRDEADGGAERAVTGHTGPAFDIELLVSLLREENARDICVIRVSPALCYVDHLVVASGVSPRHLRALAQRLLTMHKFLKSRTEPFARMEGKDSEDWLCVDFGSMVIHLMLPETREIYELEKLWTLGTYDDQLAQITPESLPEDFILGLPADDEPPAASPLEAERN